MKKLFLSILLMFTLLTCKAPSTTKVEIGPSVEMVIVPDDIHGVDTYLVIEKDTNIARVAINMVIGEKIEYDFKNTAAQTIYTSSSPIVIWIPKIPNTPFEYSVLTHETFHATKGIMDYVGIPLTDDTEEAWAYEMGYLNRKMLEALRKIKEQ